MMEKKIIQSKYVIISLLFVFILSINRIIEDGEPNPMGDAIEYTLVTEALKNHFSTEIRYSDYESFKELYTKSNKWETNARASMYDEVAVFLKNDKLKKFDSFRSLFVDDKANKYSVHFFIYPFVSIPMRWVCGFLHFNPLLIHQYTNVLLLLITCFCFYKYPLFGKLETTAFIALFFYSTNYWYLPWQHPEVFTTCFVSLGLWLFAGKKQYAGIVLISIGALQNQPLAILVGALCLITLYQKGLTIKNILSIAISSVWIFLPPVYYYFHFGVGNLAAHIGSVSRSSVTFNRVFGFFFDLNQGVILALPFVLLLYIVLLMRKIILIKKQDIKWDLFIPLALIGTVCGAAMIDNWNHGQAVVNRYVTYIAGLILVHCFILILEIKSKKTKAILVSFSLVTQLITVYYHQSITKYDWATSDPKPISNWVMENYPQYYNPDPTIFIARYGTLVAADIAQSPAYFMKSGGEITKFLVHKDYVNNLKKFGYSEEQVLSVAKELIYSNGWAYINVDETFRSKFSNAELRAMDNERRISYQMKTISELPDWYNLVKKKAQERGVDPEEMLRRDAAYVLGIVIEVKESRQEKIIRKVGEIKADAGWYNFMKEKAKKENISIDSAIVKDASYIVEEETRKLEEQKK